MNGRIGNGVANSKPLNPRCKRGLEGVYFDDLTIEHTTTPVIQKDDCYPFGLSIAGLSTQRDRVLMNRYLFQGQEHIDDLGLNWYSFKWRNHQSEIGRFFNVDKLTDKYVYNSSYAFSENKVTRHVELEGMEAVEAVHLASLVAEYKVRTLNSVENIRSGSSNFISRKSINIPNSIPMNSNQRSNLSTFAKISDANKIAQGVKDIGVTTVKMAARETLNSSQNLGEVIEIAGIATGQPEVAGTGKVISSVSKYVNLTIDYKKGKENEVDFGYEISKDIAFGALGSGANKAEKLGNLGNQANKILQGVIKGYQELTDWVKNEIVENKNK